MVMKHFYYHKKDIDIILNLSKYYKLFKILVIELIFSILIGLFMFSFGDQTTYGKFSFEQSLHLSKTIFIGLLYYP